MFGQALAVNSGNDFFLALICCCPPGLSFGIRSFEEVEKAQNRLSLKKLLREHETGQRLTETFGVFRGLLRFDRKLSEPFRRIKRLGIKRNTPDNHRDVGLQATFHDLHEIPMLAHFDAHADEFGFTEEQGLFFEKNDVLGQRFLEAQGKTLEIAFGIGRESPQPSRLEIEAELGTGFAHG